MVYLWIAAGSALGGVLRYWCSGVAAQLIGETFPWGTLIVNVAGSFAIGFFFTYTGPDGRVPVDPMTRQFVMAGICGGYTTFSSFSLQTLNLMREGQLLHAGANVSILGPAVHAGGMARPRRGVRSQPAPECERRCLRRPSCRIGYTRSGRQAPLVAGRRPCRPRLRD